MALRCAFLALLALLSTAVASASSLSFDNGNNIGYEADATRHLDIELMMKEGAYAKYVKKEGSFPVVLLCHDRPEKLERALRSLMNVRGITRRNVLLSQDGNNSEVASVIKRHRFERVQWMDNEIRETRSSGTARIAAHYRFALQTAFDRFPEAPGIIIAEDDLTFSPDFSEYFSTLAPVLSVDSTIWLITAWNDIGFKDTAGDPYSFLRTQFCPGPGWLLPRSEWEDRLRSMWPEDHWDWFMRKTEVHAERECVFPEVPRVHHDGPDGVNVGAAEQAQVLDRMHMNIDETVRLMDISFKYASDVVLGNYERRIENLIQTGKHVRSALDLRTVHPKGTVLVLWYQTMKTHAGAKSSYMARFISFMGLHPNGITRGSHNGLHECRCFGNRVIAINVQRRTNAMRKIANRSKYSHVFVNESPFVRLRPSDVPVLSARRLTRELLRAERDAGELLSLREDL